MPSKSACRSASPTANPLVVLSRFKNIVAVCAARSPGNKTTHWVSRQTRNATLLGFLESSQPASARSATLWQNLAYRCYACVTLIQVILQHADIHTRCSSALWRVGEMADGWAHSTPSPDWHLVSNMQPAPPSLCAQRLTNHAASEEAFAEGRGQTLATEAARWTTAQPAYDL